MNKPAAQTIARPVYVGITASLKGAKLVSSAPCECAMCLHYRDNLGWEVTRVTVELELPTGERRTLTHARPRWFEAPEVVEDAPAPAPGVGDLVTIGKGAVVWEVRKVRADGNAIIARMSREVGGTYTPARYIPGAVGRRFIEVGRLVPVAA